MKDVLVREVERLLYRPNISPKGKTTHRWRLAWDYQLHVAPRVEKFTFLKLPAS